MANGIAYREGLPHRPPRIDALPLDARGYPVPWFVAIVDGVPDFRVGDGRKMALAVRNRLCWICGYQLGKFLVIPIGPMCAVNRISSEPPCHRDCAEYAVRACPFILNPSAHRREKDLPASASHAGHMIPDNPGVMALWITRQCRPFSPRGRGLLFQLGEPEEVSWWRQGRAATRAEVEEAFEVGVERRLKPLCRDAGDVANVERCAAEARRWWPAEEKGLRPGESS